MRPAAILGDFASVLAILGAIGGYLPPIAALIAVLWYLLQIWESQTVQGWWVTHNHKAKLRRLRTLLAREKLIQAELLNLGLQSKARVDNANLEG